MNIKDDFILSKINKGYLVGGSVRDFLMGKHSFDRDIAVKDAENFAKKLAEQFDTYFVTLDSENKIYRLVLKDKVNYLDISEMQGNTIEEDLLRRDFTINAIAYDLETEKFIDVTGGLDDLKSGTLRHIKDENFEEDPLRVLRAFRFAAATGFEMSVELKTALNKCKHLALKPAKERIMYELLKLFGGKYADRALLMLDEYGILEEIFPCVAEMKKVPPNSHHHLDLFHHVVETVRNIEELYENSSEAEKEHLDSVDFGGFPRINHLKLAGFLHDIGKFSTWTIQEDGGKCKGNCEVCLQDSRHCGMRHRFIKHDDAGEKLCKPLLRGLKFSNKQIDYIALMIKKHIYPSNVCSSPDLSDKVKMRYIRKMENNVIDNIILAKADRLSARGEAITDEMVAENLMGLNTLLDFYFQKKEELKPLPKLLDGLEVMEILGIKQGPILGELLNSLKEAQFNGDINTKDEAIEYIKKISC